MNHFADLDLIRIRHAELRAAADHHRLVTAVRRTGRHRRATNLVGMLACALPRRVRPIAEAEPCPP